ncbi:MAG: FGGY-family carbohydrate kinase [Anaerobutyricum soehngenii]
MNKDAASSNPSANRLIYLPYLNGEQSPHFNLNCRGSFVGLAAIHTRADMTRAVMEGTTCALRDILTGIRNCGVRPETMRMCGGGSKSPFWRQLMADIYNMPVTLPDMNSENSAALGVAILAAVGTEHTQVWLMPVIRLLKCETKFINRTKNLHLFMIKYIVNSMHFIQS